MAFEPPLTAAPLPGPRTEALPEHRFLGQRSEWGTLPQASDQRLPHQSRLLQESLPYHGELLPDRTLGAPVDPPWLIARTANSVIVSAPFAQSRNTSGRLDLFAKSLVFHGQHPDVLFVDFDVLA